MHTRTIAGIPVHLFPTTADLIRYDRSDCLDRDHLYIARDYSIDPDYSMRCPIPCTICPASGTVSSSLGHTTPTSCRANADFLIQRFFSTPPYTRAPL